MSGIMLIKSGSLTALPSGYSVRVAPSKTSDLDKEYPALAPFRAQHGVAPSDWSEKQLESGGVARTMDLSGVLPSLC